MHKNWASSETPANGCPQRKNGSKNSNSVVRESYGSAPRGLLEMRAEVVWNIRSSAELSQHIRKRRTEMKLCFAAIATAALIGTALPAVAEEVGIGVGPVGVTVGEDHRDHDVVREREVVRDRDGHRDGDTVIIKKGEHDRDIDHDRRKVIIDHD